MERNEMYKRYTSLDRGWRACLLAAAIVFVEHLATAV